MAQKAKQAATAAVSFEELLRADEIEGTRWREWFAKQPDMLLDSPTDIAGAGNLRSLLMHVVGVQQRYAEWLTETPLTLNGTTAPHHTAADIFAISDRSRALLWQWLSTATPEELSKVVEYRRGEFYLRATKRKAFLQVMFHNMHHFGQIATLVRDAGHPTDWIHDFIFSPVMD